jgi:uroporphyrinogen-III synthase
LSGLRILVGRARHQASALSSELRRLGAQVLEIPFIRIQKPRSYKPLDDALQKIDSYDWLILTSVNGVHAMWQRAGKCRLGKKNFAHLKVAAIGPATEKALQKLGLTVDVVPKEYVAESVVRSLQRRVNGRRVLLVRAKIARDVIPQQLRAAGADVQVVEAYETVVPESSRARLKSALKDSRRSPDIVTFTSSSTVRNFVALLESGPPSAKRKPQLESPGLQTLKTASIGPVTSATLREVGLPVDIQAREYTIPGLVRAIVDASR